MAKTAFYAVAHGRTTGIFPTWDLCKKSVDGFQGARFKKFSTKAEAEAFVSANQAKPRQTFVFNSSGAIPSTSRKRSNDVSQVPDVKRARTIWKEFEDAPVVYTDGACSNNGKKEARAGWGVYWSDGDDKNECGRVPGDQTNNRGELLAVIKALEKGIESKYEKILVRTDSNLLIKSMEQWIGKWKRNNWKTATGQPVKNQDFLMRIDECMGKIKVKFEHVPGHAGIEGNEKADELARQGARM